MKCVVEPLSSTILHSSFVPSAEAEAALQTSISDLHSTLTTVDDEIHRLRVSLASLEGYRTDLHEHLMFRRAVLSPIRRLPAEILGEIFLFAAEGCSMIWPRAIGSKADEDAMPWLLGKICSFWRSVALSLPVLHSRSSTRYVFFGAVSQNLTFAALQQRFFPLKSGCTAHEMRS